jgi:hypothetical protein
MREAYLPVMNLSLECESRVRPARRWTEERPIYVIGVFSLLLVWALYTAVTVFVVVAVFVPGHLGLSDWLRVLENGWSGAW